MATCPNCGVPLEHEDDRFCGNCGAAIPPRVVTPTPSSVPPAAPPAKPASRGGSKNPLIILLAVGIPIVLIVGIVICIVVIGIIGAGISGGGGTRIVLHNNSGQTVYYAYVSPCGDPNWGDDDLGSATVPNGGTFTFPVAPGCYDLKAEGMNYNVIDTEMGINVSGTYDWWVP